MPPQGSPGWALRLTDLLGVRPDETREEHLARLVEGAVREDADLDFKRERYGNGESDRRELAGDIAAMANERGGVILIGIRDENDVAAELTPVEFVDGEEGRIRQIAAGNIAPHVTFDVRMIVSADDPSKGYHVLIVPPSTLRPHAVRQDRNLRYPRRDGTTTRWLGEPEIADAYRDRFATAASQTERVDQVLRDGLEAMDLHDDAFIAVRWCRPARARCRSILRAWMRSSDGRRLSGAPTFSTGSFWLRRRRSLASERTVLP